MERILRGVMRYRNTTREQMVKEFQKVRDNPQVSLISYLLTLKISGRLCVDLERGALN